MLNNHGMFLRLFPSINPNLIGGKGRNSLLNLLLKAIKVWKAASNGDGNIDTTLACNNEYTESLAHKFFSRLTVHSSETVQNMIKTVASFKVVH